MKTTALDRQSLFDIALQIAGDIEVVFAIAETNALSITDDLTSGQTIQYDVNIIKDHIIVKNYANNKIIPVTDISQAAKIMPDGIGFWGIEYDFMVW